MSTIAQRPDFSGDWKLNPQASRLSPVVAPVVRSGTLRIRHHEPRFASHLVIDLPPVPYREPLWYPHGNLPGTPNRIHVVEPPATVQFLGGYASRTQSNRCRETSK
jgi:hypothetical protein